MLDLQFKGDEEVSEEEKENEIINVSSRNLGLRIPRIDGAMISVKVNWIQNLEDDYFLAGMTYLDNPRDEGHTLWVLKLDEEKGFIPVVCALYY